jgi:hypothetical protein
MTARVMQLLWRTPAVGWRKSQTRASPIESSGPSMLESSSANKLTLKAKAVTA